MQTNLSKWRAIKGHLPKVHELAAWTEDHFLRFFDFVAAFSDGDKVKIVPEVRMAKENEAMKGDNPFLEELFQRMDSFTNDPKRKSNFAHALQNMKLAVGNYLKRHPASMSETMREKLPGTMRWCDHRFKSIDTKMGVPVVIPDTAPQLRSPYPTQSPKGVELQIAEAQAKIGDLMNAAFAGINAHTLKKLTPKERITIGFKAYEILQKHREWRPNIGVLNQIKVNVASREDLESALLDVGKARENE